MLANRRRLSAQPWSREALRKHRWAAALVLLRAGKACLPPLPRGHYGPALALTKEIQPISR